MQPASSGYYNTTNRYSLPRNFFVKRSFFCFRRLYTMIRALGAKLCLVYLARKKRGENVAFFLSRLGSFHNLIHTQTSRVHGVVVATEGDFCCCEQPRQLKIKTKKRGPSRQMHVLYYALYILMMIRLGCNEMQADREDAHARG
ncbi:unnamed protein product [Trichogramma brassicae]|uniref:Uncharacterized protein n=1 Tax=Trichogramma brassicae TaxID=86971 RepID=A0A6H5I479_9HYME|nr:unnamed protein product [Trichogramma brassicae]